MRCFGGLCLAIVGLVSTVNTGCFGGECGTVKCQTEYVDSQRPVALDDHEYYERCGGLYGSWGHHYDDGTSTLLFGGSHDDGTISAAAASMFLEVVFETSMIKPGQLMNLVGAGYVIDYDGSQRAVAPFTSGTIELVEDEGLDDYGDHQFHMRWDLTFGEPGVSRYWYTAKGDDSVHFLED